MIDFPCPHCRATIRASDNMAGSRGVCGRCRRTVQIPCGAVSARPMAATPKAQWTDTSRGSNVPVRRGVPLWVFAVALTVGIVLVSCLVIGLLVAVIPPDVPTAAATAAPLPVPVSPARDNVSPVTRNDPPVVTTKGPPVKEYGVGELIRIGDIGLIVMKARVEPFASVDAIGQPQEQNAQFVVRMGMQSLNPNRVVDVESQADVAR